MRLPVVASCNLVYSPLTAGFAGIFMVNTGDVWIGTLELPTGIFVGVARALALWLTGVALCS
jgi:hypothetical protein